MALRIFVLWFAASLSIAACSQVIAQVFSPSPTASSGTIPEGTGQALYGNFGIGANALNPTANSYNVYRKYQTNGQTPPASDLHTLDPDASNPTSAFWDNLNQGGTPGAGNGFTTGFKAPGMFIGQSPSTSSYEDQLLNFGPVVDIGALPDGNFNGDSSNRREWELRVGFLEDPDGYIADNAPNSGEFDIWDGRWGSDGVSMNIFIGTNDEASPTGNPNWYTMTQFEGTQLTGSFYGQSGAANTAIAAENGRDNLPMSVSRIVTGEVLDDLLEPGGAAGSQSVFQDTGVDYDDFVEVSWNMQLNDPSAPSGTLEARQVKFTAKVGNVVYNGLFDPGDVGNPVTPNPTNDANSPYLDGFFDWRNATPVLYLGADNETAPGAVGVQGVFIPGDFDGNGTVDGLDLEKWDASVFDITTTFSRGDGDQNGLTDIRDLITWSGGRFGPSANTPEFTYDPATGELSLNGGGAEIHAFAVEIDEANVVSVTAANLPNGVSGWNVDNFRGAVQGNDYTLTEDGSSNPATGNHVIATLATGLTAADFGRITFADATGSASVGITIGGGVGNPDCDFDNSGVCDLADINMLMYTGLGTANASFDLDGSGTVDLADRDAWLRQAGSLIGDANLDGKNDAGDLNAVGTNWQSTTVKSWANGDFTGDGNTDAADLNGLGIWWTKTAADFSAAAASPAAVPEPTSLILTFGGLLGLLSGMRRRRS